MYCEFSPYYWFCSANPLQSDRSAIIDVDHFVQSSVVLLAQHGLSMSFLSTDELKHVVALAHVASITIMSVLGSILAQEVIKAVSRSGEPAYNVMVFSGMDYVAREFAIATVNVAAAPVVNVCNAATMIAMDDEDEDVVVTGSAQVAASTTAAVITTKSNQGPPARDVMDLVDDDVVDM